jgi:hypothetical protein
MDAYGLWNHAAQVTPSNTNQLQVMSDFISFVNAGTQALVIVTPNDETVPVLLPSGMWRIRAKQVLASHAVGTTQVTSIVAYWV